MKKSITSIAILCSLLIRGQVSNPFYVGHSLVNFDMPYFVKALATAAGKQTYYGSQVMNGASLMANYNNSGSAQGTPYTTAFPNGNYNTLVLTEAVPLQNHLTWSSSYLYANNFYNYAKNNNNNVPIKFYVYETWHCTNSGIPNSNPNFPNGCWYDNSANSSVLWQPRLLLDFPLWSGIVTHVRNQNPNDTQIWMVPAGQAFYNLTTQINASNVPGITNFTDLFTDDIHLTNSGNYFVACVMFATLYQQSPVGLTTAINDTWGNPIPNMPTAAQAFVMQQVAWKTVRDLSLWTGIRGRARHVPFAQQATSDTLSSGRENYSNNVTDLSNSNFGETLEQFSIYPNPSSSDHIAIAFDNFEENHDVLIYNSVGKLVKEVLVESNTMINISDLPSGLYLVKLKNTPTEVSKFIKY